MLNQVRVARGSARHWARDRRVCIRKDGTCNLSRGEGGARQVQGMRRPRQRLAALNIGAAVGRLLKSGDGWIERRGPVERVVAVESIREGEAAAAREAHDSIHRLSGEAALQAGAEPGDDLRPGSGTHSISPDA